jgi:hypothetical protein
VPLKRVGESTVPPSTHAATRRPAGSGTITGGAVAPGGGEVVLRTYTDALEWDVPAATCWRAPEASRARPPLPNEPLGEAITYSPTAGTSTRSPTCRAGRRGGNYILRYTPGHPTARRGRPAGRREDDGAVLVRRA